MAAQMFKTATIVTLIASSIAFSAAAQTENESAGEDAHRSWLDNTIARCVQQYSAEQCQNQEFLDEHFQVTSLQVAHRAASRRNEEAGKALRELTLQRVCNDAPAKSCASTGVDVAQCSAEITQACATLQAEAAACVQNATSLCIDNVDPNACYRQQLALCPSAKKQPIEQLLAKYPKLTAAQKSRLINAAAELDAKYGSWWSDMVAWLKAPFY